MRYAFFWRPRGSREYRLEEFEARGFSEAVKVAKTLLEVAEERSDTWSQASWRPR